MIKKFIEIKNVGKFLSYNHSGGEIKKLALYYGENGTGKSTIVNILRALSQKNDDLIKGRKTLGETGSQYVGILTDNGVKSFKDNKWDGNYRDIEIFDTTFIRENVYTSYYVDIDHKRKLQELIIGASGVKIANEITEIDSESREISTKLKELESLIRNKTKGDIDIQKFIDTKNIENVDKKIEAAKKSENAKEHEKTIRFTQGLKELVIPIFDKEEFKILMKKTYIGVSEEASKEVNNHIREKLDDNGKEWIEKGIKYIKDDNCPFCTQNITRIKLVEYYKEIYSEAFLKSINETRTGISNFLEFLRKVKVNDFKLEMKNNEGLVTIWNEYLEDKISLAHISKIKFEEIFNVFSFEIEKLTKEKLSDINKEIIVTKEIENKINDYNELCKNFLDYNQSVTKNNVRIEELRTKVSENKINIGVMNINYYENIKIRYSEEMIKLIDEYNTKTQKKIELNNKKTQKKDEITELNSKLLCKFKDTINLILEQCGADFTVEETETSYIGGKASIKYKLKINKIAFDIGDEKTTDSKVSFKNTLSEGDKSCLAFAFFVAQLLESTDLNQKIIVIDDPISSLDYHRKEATINLINRILSKCKQLFLFTHDPEFSAIFWEKTMEKQKESYIIRKTGLYSSMEIFDMGVFGQGDYFHNYMVLFSYLNDNKGDKINVAKTIRPILESNLRFRFPASFNSYHGNKWLGDFLKMINESDSDKDYYVLKKNYEELSEINDYSKKFHHDTGGQSPPIDLTKINESELKTFVKRTLDFCTQ